MAAAAQAFVPVPLPLFDGVVVSDPYRYLAPPPGGDGSPTSADTTIAIVGGVSPAFAVYTSETPPQAELLAHGGELAVAPTSTSVRVAIDPIAPPSDASGGTVAGNVYRVTVTDQSGASLALLPGQSITVALRGPAGIAADASIGHLVGGRWQKLPTDPSGLPDLFLTNASAFGDFAVLGTVATTPGGFDPQILLLALIPAGLLVLGALRYGGSGRGGGAAPPTRKRRSRQAGRTSDGR